jgi:hypothetical protein
MIIGNDQMRTGGDGHIFPCRRLKVEMYCIFNLHFSRFIAQVSSQVMLWQGEVEPFSSSCLIVRRKTLSKRKNTAGTGPKVLLGLDYRQC